MGNWISIYSDELAEIKKVVGSRDTAVAEKVIERYQQKAGNYAKSETIEAIKRLVEGRYEAGKQPYGHTLIYAFEHLLKAFAKDAGTAEICVDESRFPQIFEFVWDDAGDDPFSLPVSQHGSPACIHWGQRDVQRFLQLFNMLDFEALQLATDSDYSAEVENICKVLQAANARNQGVFVFFNE